MHTLAEIQDNLSKSSEEMIVVEGREWTMTATHLSKADGV